MSRRASTLTGGSIWQHEAARLMEIIRRHESSAAAPIQGVVIDDQPGYGAARLLDVIYRDLRNEGGATARLQYRPDSITDWPSLAEAILSAAGNSGAPHGLGRADLNLRRRSYASSVWRDEIDDLMRETFKKHGRLTLLVPYLDRLVSGLPPDDHWAFRNILQTQPLALIATASITWRPDRDAAFYEFFRRLIPRGYTEEGVASLGARLALNKVSLSTLQALRATWEGRPALIDAAATALATDPDSELADLVRWTAEFAAPFLSETLAGLAPQSRLVWAESIRLGLPVASGAIAEATDLASGAVSTQLSRLETAGVLRADKPTGRNRQYAAGDQVVASLYAALIDVAP